MPAQVATPTLRSTAPAFRCFVGSGGVFLALALVVGSWGLLPGERFVYDAVGGWIWPAGVPTFKAINYLGGWQFLVPGTLLLIWLAPAEARRRWWLWVGVIVVAAILGALAKHIIGRPRPVGHAFGFPSGHVTAAATYFFLLAYLMSRRLKDRASVLWIAAGVSVALVGMARIVLHAHWPADVLGGATLGLALASISYWWHEGNAQEGGVLREAGPGWDWEMRGASLKIDVPAGREEPRSRR